MRRLFTPHVNKIRSCLEPGLSEVNWTNFEWRDFTERCISDIENFADLMSRANDIYSNRIEKLLYSMNTIKLYALPETEPWTLEKFLDEIKMTCKVSACDLHRISQMVEDAVEDLIGLALLSLNLQEDEVEEKASVASSAQSPSTSGDEEEKDKKKKNDSSKLAKNRFRSCVAEARAETADNNSSTPNLLQVLDKNSQNAVNNAAKELRRNYAKKVADKLANLTKTSLKILSKHFASASSDSGSKDSDMSEVKDASMIVFVLTAYLSIPDIEVKPSIDEVQGVLVHAAKIIVSVSKGVGQWKKGSKKKKKSNRLAKSNGWVPTSESGKEMRLYSSKKEEKPVVIEKSSNFYKMVSESKEVTKMYAMISSCMQGIKLEFNQFNQVYKS